MTNAKVKATIGRILLTLALALPALLVFVSHPTMAADGWTNTGTIYLTNTPLPAGSDEKCYTNEFTSTNLRKPNVNAIEHNPFCRCLDGINATKSSPFNNPTSWLLKTGGSNSEPSNFAYQAKLRANNTVDDYCKCRNSESGGYCTCLFADRRSVADCAEYKPPSYDYSSVQNPNDVTFKSIGECQATGQSFSYCNCRLGGGTHSRCFGLLGSDSQYTTALNACKSSSSGLAPDSLVLNYCSCVAVGNDEASCQDSSGYGAYMTQLAAGGVRTTDVRASNLTAEQAAQLQAQGTAAPEAEGTGEGTAAAANTGAGTTTSRLFGLPSIVPACARATGGDAPSLNCLMQVFGNVANLIVGITGSMALLMFIWGGSQMVFAAGDDSKVKKGKDTLKTAVIGIFIIMLSGYVVNYALGKLGVSAPVQGARCEPGVRPAKVSANGKGVIVNVGSESLCFTSCQEVSELKGAGFNCTDYRQRAEGKSDCLIGLCPGDEFNVCCPSGTTK